MVSEFATGSAASGVSGAHRNRGGGQREDMHAFHFYSFLESWSTNAVNAADFKRG
jgi:hypothetical protein